MVHRAIVVVGFLAVALDATRLLAAENLALRAAVESVSTADMRRHVDVLADDGFEGREAGTRGGQAAGNYLLSEFKKHRLAAGGPDGSFFQPFGNGYRNILGYLEGSDPVLKREVLVVGAHYDHVGLGQRRNSYGPIGYIHNGADDNASGTAGLLELLEAFCSLETRPRRSILFALWDAEEIGLLGSKHWLSAPTVPLEQVRFAFNMDMIGRMRNDTLEVYGVRTAPGLRRLITDQNTARLRLNFSWEMKADSDHHPFFGRGIPVVMFHTGLHEDYHRPSDDAEKINHEGAQRTVRLALAVLSETANAAELPRFRESSRSESPAAQVRRERTLPPPPGRLGVLLAPTAAPARGVVLTRIDPNSPAEKAGLRVGDVVTRVAEADVRTEPEFRAAVLGAANPVRFVVDRPGEQQPVEVVVELAGEPIRVGVSWREDEAEPGTVFVVQVIPGSRAEQAGLKELDRIHRLNDRPFADSGEFDRLIRAAAGPTELTVERGGIVMKLKLPLPESHPSAPAPVK